MNSAHEGPQVALDVAAHVGLTGRAVVEPDTIALAASTQSLAVEFTGIVEMQNLEYAIHRPIQVNRERLEPFRFGQARHAERHGDRSR